MVDLTKHSFNEINKKADGSIVLFGSGNIAKKTKNKINSNSIEFIADNSKNLQGETYLGLPIHDPKKITPGHFVVITSTAITDIAEQLISYDFEPNKDFVISPELNDRIGINELENVHTNFYFTSGAISGTDKVSKYGNNKYGGGLFKCTVEGLNYDYERIYKGPCYGSVRVGDRILFIDTDEGLMELHEGEINKMTTLPSNSRPHGISYNESNEKYYIACSYRDAVLELDKSFSITNEFKISNKIDYYDEPMHHCNDCIATENSLYVSMFSSSGNWKKESYDGCVAEFNIETGERLRDVQTDLRMPHNIDIFRGGLHVMDSLTGELLYNHLTPQASFPAFSRGLDYNDGIYYVGQSKNRNHSKIMGAAKTVSIDCGVVLFDPDLSISRFLHFPDVAGVHSITC